jgi:hypothetical protein
MQTRAFIGAVGLISVSVFLGATVFREDIAQAAQAVSAEIVGPLDAQGNVKVHEQGIAAVKLDRDGNVVRIASSSSAPVVVDEVDTPTFEPWQREGENHVELAVPAGRVAVVDYVSGRCFSNTAIDIAMSGITVTTTEDGNEVRHFVPSAYQHVPTGFNYSGATGEMVRIYADGGTTIEAQVAGAPPCVIGLSGHLEG